MNLTNMSQSWPKLCNVESLTNLYINSLVCHADIFCQFQQQKKKKKILQKIEKTTMYRYKGIHILSLAFKTCAKLQICHYYFYPDNNHNT